MSKVHTAIIVDENTLYSIEEVCEACGIPTELLLELIEHGIIEPIGLTQSEWQFTAISLHRSQKAMRLQNDLGVNLPGIALALDLLDELKDLRARLEMLERQIK